MENKTILIGLGNPLLGDDAVGWRIAEQAAPLVAPLGVDVECLAAGGLLLMEHLVGYERAVVVDSINLKDVPTGTVRAFALSDLPNPNAGHLGSAHETNLQEALKIAQLLGVGVPADIQVVAVESPYVFDFSEELTPVVAQAVPRAVTLVRQILEKVALAVEG